LSNQLDSMNSHRARRPRTSSSSRRAGRVSPLALLGGVLLLALGAAVLVALKSESWDGEQEKRQAAATDPTLPSVAPLKGASSTPAKKSEFLNTGPEVKYVGSEACRNCHAEHTETFRHGGMGRSMAEIDLTREPADATFDHPLSRRRYEVRRRDGKLWHRELLLTSGSADSEEILLAEFPAKYVVGSGDHALSYLVESESFLMESPITWYRSSNKWGMSPGYDAPEHLGFQRETGQGCLICHAGQSRALGGSVHRMEITEAAIGCERCHGPGALHVEHHRAKEPSTMTADSIDRTIVNPAHLSRELGEAVCQQCHLSGYAAILARGTKLGDFRPGLRLQDFRHDYGLKTTDKDMTVVGHVEQMHHSRCYQKTQDFSCITCHSPHGEPEAKSKVTHYQSICLKCHSERSCKVEPARRARESAENDCVHCHMPQSKTEIPHLAFTHHRVGIPDAKTAGGDDSTDKTYGAGTLAPILDLEGISPLEKKISLGLAYLEASSHPSYANWHKRFDEEALYLLTQVKESGLQDGMVDSGLARVRFRLHLPEVGEYAESALQDPTLLAEYRCYSLFILAEQYHRQRRDREAIPLLKELGELRRDVFQWQLRAECERATGNQRGMEEALQTAVRIDPRLWQVHQTLAGIYKQKGDLERAAFHAKRAVK
jgi:predicted CXXCH cytochrome family protein